MDTAERCHYTPTDLVCATRMGQVFLVCNYREALAAPERERLARVTESTIRLDLVSAITHLAIRDTHVVAVTVRL